MQKSSKKYLPNKKKVHVFAEKEKEKDESEENLLEGYDSKKSNKVEKLWK